jgi:hypothetical protein
LGLLRVWLLRVELVFDCDGEAGQVGVADDLAELVSPEPQFFTLRWVRRTVSIIDSHALVDSSVRRSLLLIPSLITVSVSSMPSRSELAAPGWVWSSSPARRWSCSSARG